MHNHTQISFSATLYRRWFSTDWIEMKSILFFGDFRSFLFRNNVKSVLRITVKLWYDQIIVLSLFSLLPYSPHIWFLSKQIFFLLCQSLVLKSSKYWLVFPNCPTVDINWFIFFWCDYFLLFNYLFYGEMIVGCNSLL